MSVGGLTPEKAPAGLTVCQPATSGHVTTAAPGYKNMLPLLYMVAIRFLVRFLHQPPPPRMTDILPGEQAGGGIVWWSLRRHYHQDYLMNPA